MHIEHVCFARRRLGNGAILKKAVGIGKKLLKVVLSHIFIDLQCKWGRGGGGGGDEYTGSIHLIFVACTNLFCVCEIF